MQTDEIEGWRSGINTIVEIEQEYAMTNEEINQEEEGLPNKR